MPSDQSSKLDAAWQRRAPLHSSATTNAYRLINRSGDGFPDLVVDRYGDVLVAHVYSQGVKVSPPRAMLQALADRVGARSVYIKYRPVQGNVLDDRARRCSPDRARSVGQLGSWM
jgi:23S rRNA G2069 N7-methylase RlmK/C1962 C5-methylase RlmI